MLRFACVGCALLFATTLTRAVTQPAYEHNLPREHPAIGYSSHATSDVLADFAARLESGELNLVREPQEGVIPSLLKALDINRDSQLLVFSKTSLQHPLISPRRPRAIYFNDEVALGVVPGAATIELAAMDPRQGAQFYVLQGRQSTRPTIARRDVCLQCHHGPATLGVPGMFVSSVFPTASGAAERTGAIVTDHRTAYADRWGGWYITGLFGSERHRGNAVARNPADPTALERESAQSVTRLDGRFDLTAYLEPSSDIVALITYEHQTFMLNLLTRLNWEARMAEHGDGAAGTAQLERRIAEVARYMLFTDEPPLPSPVVGVSTFSRTFVERGPKDRRGRALREFDLHGRLFKYPLSYAIYSRTFDALPKPVRERLYRRLYDALTGRSEPDLTRHTSPEERVATLEIVRDTKKDLPAYWAEHGR